MHSWRGQKVAKGTDSEVRMYRSWSWLDHLSAVGPCTNSSAVLEVSFLICEMGTVRVVSK